MKEWKIIKLVDITQCTLGNFYFKYRELYLERYQIIQKLGWGHFSTVWLAKDLKFETYVALKIQKSAQHYIEAAYDEVEILQELEKHNYEKVWVDSVKEYWKDNPEKIKNGIEMDHSQVVQLLNSFIHNGPNGKHFCMVFEIMGVTLLEIIKRYNYKGVNKIDLDTFTLC
jgi:serine/threonine-protein kinase SRPK3